MSRPRLLDLFSGAGGCAVGYAAAGFDVTGVDIEPMPRYPFRFVQADALAYVAKHGHEFDAIHASPPCQAYTSLQALHKHVERDDLLAPTREELRRSGRPWVIENVPGSPVRSGVMLCGSMFGLGARCRDGEIHQLRRHRYFEASFLILGPACCHVGRPVGVYGNGGGHPGRANQPGINGFTGNAQERREAMGIDWMNRGELSQAIPPAYTRFIGDQLMQALSLEAGA